MVWGLAIAGLLLIAAACVLMIYGNHIFGSNTTPTPAPTSTATSTNPEVKK